MSQQKQPTEYLVALAAWSSHHIWVQAENADDAEALAHELWSKDESAFSYKDGGIDGVAWQLGR